MGVAMINHEKLMSVLNLTTSDSDNEALVAIRTANRMLQKNKLTWNDYFKVPKVVRAEPRQEPKKEQPKETPKERKSTQVQDMIKFIRENAWPDFNFDFVDSLEVSHNKYGSLTPKQYQALKKIFKMIILFLFSL